MAHSKQVRRKDKRRATGVEGTVTAGIGGLSKANQEKIGVRLCVCVCVCVCVTVCSEN